MPAVNFDLMYQAMIRDAKARAGSNKVVYWSKLSDWKNQTLTPNPDAVYFMPFFDTKDVGPVVLEIPPADESGSITGSVMDCWQAALEDVGTAGVDKGKGAKCLILPPNYKAKVPDGYHHRDFRRIFYFLACVVLIEGILSTTCRLACFPSGASSRSHLANEPGKAIFHMSSVGK